MKILHVFRTCCGGLNRHLEIVGVRLPEVNIEPIFCGPREALDNTKISVNYDLPIYDEIHTGSTVSNIYKLKSIISTEQPDLIHAHGYKASLITYGASRITSTPWICSIHNFRKWQKTKQIANHLTNYVTREIFLDTERLICVSKALSQDIESQGIDKSKIKVIYNGIPMSYHHGRIRSKISNNPNKKIIACIGRLIPDKGIDNFIRAIKFLIDNAESFVNFMNVHFIIVGDGPSMKYYQRLSWKLKVSPYISFVGNRNDIADILKQIDLLCIPSRYEGQSITAVEAMASFCPVIASKVGGLSEVISHGENGLLVSRDDYEDLARKMLYLVKSKKFSRKLAFQAYRHVLANFSDISMVNQLAQLYHEVNYARKQISK